MWSRHEYLLIESSRMLTYQCPECYGTKKARRAPICSGVDGMHSDAVMAAIDEELQDTRGLVTR